MKISTSKWDTGRRSDFSVRDLLALVIALGGTLFVLEFSGRIYYVPLCERYADAHRLTYHSYTPGWRKKGHPAECFFRDKRGNLSDRVEASTLQLTSSDQIRWVLSWIAQIAGVGGSVWMAHLVGGYKSRRRRHKKRHKNSPEEIFQRHE